MMTATEQKEKSMEWLTRVGFELSTLLVLGMITYRDSMDLPHEAKPLRIKCSGKT